jgi:hypothetical protein
MKEWQKGYELEYLKKITKYFSDYNEFSRSPFSEMNPNTIATALEKGHLEYLDGNDNYTSSSIESYIQTVKRDITVDGTIVIGTKEKGDRIIKRISGDVFPLVNKIETFAEPCWLFIWEECVKSKNVVSFLNQSKISNGKFKKVGAKISSFAEIQGVYFKDVPGYFGEREHPFVPEYEKFALTKLKIEKTDSIEAALVGIRGMLKTLPEFTNHYSNYNDKGSWKALSLRGYRSDSTFITKPVEMNKKWKKENEGSLNWQIEDTPLRAQFPEVEVLLDQLPGEKHRIRFMSLKPKDGELRRHTDLVDPDQGIADGKLARIHFPIVTNDKVLFQNWDWNGKADPINMKVGEAWYLDVRKPHRAVNSGDTHRIHMVIDVVSSEELRKLL